MGAIRSLGRKCWKLMWKCVKFNRIRRPYVIPASSLEQGSSTPLPSPSVPMELQALEYQLSISKAQLTSTVVPTGPEQTVDKRTVYNQDTGKRSTADRAFLPGDQDYSVLNGVLVLSRAIRTN
jgi:hypothetical protein